jgi:hypothetical protein
MRARTGQFAATCRLRRRRRLGPVGRNLTIRLWTGCGQGCGQPSNHVGCRRARRCTAGRWASNGLSIRCATQAAPRPSSECAAQPIIADRQRIASRRRIPGADAASPQVPERKLTSICAGQWWCGAPRRNRTGDTILTMNPGRSAVPLRVFAAQRRPWGPYVWDQSPSQVSSSATTRLAVLEDLDARESTAPSANTIVRQSSPAITGNAALAAPDPVGRGRDGQGSALGRRRLIQRCPPGGRILDAAGETGKYLAMILGAGRQVVEADQSAGMLAQTRAHHPCADRAGWPAGAGLRRQVGRGHLRGRRGETSSRRPGRWCWPTCAGPCAGAAIPHGRTGRGGAAAPAVEGGQEPRGAGGLR